MKLRLKLKLAVLAVILGLYMIVPSIKAKPDDCEVAWQIAYEQEFGLCMIFTTDEGLCNGQARNEANRHVVALGCAPHN
jgi:hypothetical protein